MAAQPKKKKKIAPKGKLSFGLDDEDDSASSPMLTSRSATNTPRSITPLDGVDESGRVTPRLRPNTSVAFTPKALTKAAVAREAETRERLRKEFLEMQKIVKATEIVLPFVFYDGTNIPGGICRMTKGDPVWLFLDKSRKLGAEASSGTDKSRREWARVGIDDLMLVRNEIIIPHVSPVSTLGFCLALIRLQHYELYYFMANKTPGFTGPLFPFSDRPTEHSLTAAQLEPEIQPDYDPLSVPGKKKERISQIPDDALEGFNSDPSITKVVDRRWYERNKHIFPASIWEDFDPTKDYSNAVRKDGQGNSYFLS